MKPNAEQQEYLKARLSGILKYRETYAEVYDHILLALEGRSVFEDFESIVNKLIEKDFGGEQSLRKMEDQCRIAAIKKVRTEYKLGFWSWFKTPSLLAALVSTFLLLNYIALQSLIAAEVIWGLIVLVSEISFIVRRINAGYLFGGAKASLRDAILKKLTYGSIFIFLRITIISQSVVLLFSIPAQLVHYIDQVLITSYAVLFIARATSLYKLFKSNMELSLNP